MVDGGDDVGNVSDVHSAGSGSISEASTAIVPGGRKSSSSSRGKNDKQMLVLPIC